MAKTKFNFTDERLRKLVHNGSSKRLYLYDTVQPGLVLQVTPKGTKSFQLQVWDKSRGKSVVKSLGQYPATSIQESRNKVAEYRLEINKGKDILEEAKAFKEEDTFGKVFTRWLDVAKEHKKSWKHDESRYSLYIKPPFGNKRLSWFSSEKIEKWHIGLTQKTKQRKGPNGEDVKISKTTANRALALVNTVFNSKLVKIENPCKGVKKFKETPRDRFLQPDELKKFFEAIESPETPDMLKDYILISLYTGARRSNVMAMRWSDINVEQSIWRIPPAESKNSEAMNVPLIEPATTILQKRKSGASSVFVFPGDGATGHLVEPKRAWKTFLKNAGLHDVRLHDLRRTLGSYQTIGGTSLTIVGKTLGHRSHEATQVYARLNLDPVRASMEKAVGLMLASKELPDKVVHIKQGNE
jgi:integrase